METPGEGPPARMEPDDAFGAIAHETRIDILRVLATTDRANRPVRFSEIRDQLGDIQSAHFNYHLKELTGEFVEQTDDGYDFRKPGRRIAQAILSGAVTGNQLSEVTDVEQDCHHCGGSLKIMYHDERIAIYCPDCSGTYASSNYQNQHDEIPDEYGYSTILGSFQLGLVRGCAVSVLGRPALGVGTNWRREHSHHCAKDRRPDAGPRQEPDPKCDG